MKLISSKQTVWARELNYVQTPTYWKTFAIETKNCLEFLLQKFEEDFNSDVVSMKVFFGYKYVRMMMGYALENLIKGLLLSGSQKNKFIKNNKIKFGNHGHNLIWLLKNLQFQYDQEEKFFLEAWSISAEWFGKYPFPNDMNDCLEEYSPMKSSMALSRRSLSGKRKVNHYDLLHTGIGDREKKLFANIFERILKLYTK